MFEIKSPEDLAKVLADLADKSAANAKQGEEYGKTVDQVMAELREVKEAVAQIGQRPMGAGAGKVVKIPVTQKEWADHGMKSLFLTKVGVKKTRDGFEVEDSPIANFQSAGSLVLMECALRRVQPTKENFRNMTLYRELFVPAREAAFGIVKEAFNISTAGEGAEWVPDQVLAAEMVQRVRLGWKVAGLFRRIPTKGFPFTFPVFRDDVTSYYVATPTSSSGSDVTEGLGTVNVSDDMTFTGKRLMSRLIWSWDFNEDTVMEAASELRDASAASMSNSEEMAVLDGDSDGSHMDSDVGASTTDARVMFNGLRKTALAGTAKKDVANNAIDSSGSWNTYVRRGVFTPMGRYGVNGSDVAVITGAAVSNQVRSIERFSTAEVFANALNKLANINDGSFSPDGISDFVVSEFVRENLNAAGVYDGITTDKTYFLVVNKNAWRMAEGQTVGFKILDQTRAAKAQTELIFTRRIDLQQCYDFDTKHTGIGYDVNAS